MTEPRDRLFQQLPAAMRARDAEVGGPLAALLGLLGDQVLHLREDLRQLYDDQFIETCAEWVVPYIGDLIGHEPRHGTIPRIASPRAEVAHTVGYRRRKGTAAVLQQLGQDVTGWPTRVVEVFRRLGVAQHLNFPRPDHPHTPDLRRARPLLTLGTPFSTIPVRPDVRDDRHQSLPDIVAYVWRLRAFPLQRVTPAPVGADGLRFTFSPLGDPVALFSRPQGSEDAQDRSDPAHVPAPIGRREFHDRRDLYYGEDRSLWVRVGADIVPGDLVDAADLSDQPGDPSRWCRPARAGRLAIDPVLGRLALSDAFLGEPVTVGFHTGAVTELGGGQYERDTLGPDAPPATVVVRDNLTATALATAAATTDGVLELADSATLRLTLGALPLPRGARLTIRAADRERPLLLLASDLRILGEADLTLDGLVIAGGALVVPADSGLRSLTLRHCTLVPGLARDPLGRAVAPAAPSLVASAPDLVITLQDCITGPLRAVDTARVAATRCVIDAGPDGLAHAAPNGKAGAPLDLDRCTVLGQVHALSFGRVSETILHGPATSDRRQTGCMRFSAVRADASVPRRFRCVTTTPQFAAIRYGAPAYAQLSRRCDPAIRTGAADEAELGVFHDLFEPHREGNLRARLDEYLRLGLRVGVTFVT